MSYSTVCSKGECLEVGTPDFYFINVYFSLRCSNYVSTELGQSDFCVDLCKVQLSKKKVSFYIIIIYYLHDNLGNLA